VTSRHPESAKRDEGSQDATISAFGDPSPSARLRMTIEAVLESGNRVRFTAIGDSMHPFIRSGHRVVVEPVDPSALRRGDVVLARLERGLTAHRVVRIERRGGDVVRITTRGDNCELDDPPFSPDQLLGRVNRSRWGSVLGALARMRRAIKRRRTVQQ